MFELILEVIGTWISEMLGLEMLAGSLDNSEAFAASFARASHMLFASEIGQTTF